MMPCAKNEELSVKIAFSSSASRGFSLVELMVTMVIFGILMTGIFQAYTAQMRNTAREYGIAESDIDRSVGQGIINRDIFMAGYGLADDYTGAISPVTGIAFAPWALQATDGTGGPDTLTLMGTALGMNSQQAQHWSYVTAVNADETHFTPKQWLDAAGDADSRENLQNLDMVIMLEASSKRLLSVGGGWLYKYLDPDNDPATEDDNTLETTAGSNLTPVENGAVLYGLYKNGSLPEATQPYYTVQYRLSTTPGTGCANGVGNLLRQEWRTAVAPALGGTQIIPCVADFQVAIGLDTNNDREIDIWQNGGVTTAGGYDPARLNRSLRQIRVYALTQIGERDRFYTYPSPTIQVGDPSLGTGVGRTFTLSDEQRKYRWRVIRFVAVPRNIR